VVAHRRDAGGEVAQQRPRPLLHLDLVQATIRDEFAAEPDVGHDIQVLAQRQILEHRRDAEVVRVRGIRQRHDPSVVFERAAVGGVNPREHLHQCRLARAVVAHEGDDLALIDPEVDLAERRDGTETLGGTRHRQDAVSPDSGHGAVSPASAHAWA
jgi:hypothetical protein